MTTPPPARCKRSPNCSVTGAAADKESRRSCFLLSLVQTRIHRLAPPLHEPVERGRSTTLQTTVILDESYLLLVDIRSRSGARAGTHLSAGPPSAR